MFTRLSPTTRLLLAAALAWTLIAVALSFWTASLPPHSASHPAYFLVPPGLAAGTWLGLFFLAVPLPAPRPLARASAALGAFLAGLAAPLITALAVALITDYFASPDLFGFVEVFRGPAFGPAALVGLGFGWAGYAAHRALDPRLRERCAGRLAWLPTSTWAGTVPLIILFPDVTLNMREDMAGVALSVILLLATLPHLLAQIILARYLASSTPALP